MKFLINRTQGKEETTYKSLYIKQSLADAVEQLAKENHTSWNNIVISMIESCLSNEEEEE